MYKLLILCCVNIISVTYAAPIKSDANINEILQQLEFLKKCPAVLNNNINKHISDGGLSHCKNVTIGNAPEQIDLKNLNEFYCIGLLAADIQLCSGNKTNKLPKNYDDLKSNIDKIKNEKPEKICNELKQLQLSGETVNVTNLNKWVEVLNKNLHDSSCVGLCSEVENGKTNMFCSMIYYMNNNITYETIPEKILIQPPPKVVQDMTVAPTIKDNVQKKVTISSMKEVTLNSNTNVVAVENIKTTEPATSSANIKDNTPPSETKVETVKLSEPVVSAPSGKMAPPPVINQPEAAINKPQKEEQPVIEIATVKQVIPVQNQKDSISDVAPITPVAPVKPVQITEGSKQPSPAVNPNAVVEENQKVATNVESSSVSSTISAARDDLSEDYFEDLDENNKENEADQLIPQTNIRKEAIEILENDQDRHRIPSEDDDDMEESNFFSYFMFVSVMFIAGYVVYHNKQKIMALLLEGRRDRNSRRRPNTASYRKLNSNLEEAVTSKCSGSASHVIY